MKRVFFFPKIHEGGVKLQTLSNSTNGSLGMFDCKLLEESLSEKLLEVEISVFSSTNFLKSREMITLSMNLCSSHLKVPKSKDFLNDFPTEPNVSS